MRWKEWTDVRITSAQLYDCLMNRERITRLEGQIQFVLGDVQIIVKQRDVVGNIIQEWLEGWIRKRGIDYAPSTNTQMPPDFFLNPQDLTKDLLEVKAFNIEGTPGFDIADFRMYAEEIVEKPYMLDVDYLVFGYHMSPGGIVTIRNLWLKKVWELTRRMDDWPLNLQIKANVVHKIRPGKFYGEGRRGSHPMFRSMEDFLSAVEATVYQNPKTHDTAGRWKRNFLRSYEMYYGQKIKIPRWDDIEDTY